VQYDLHKTKLGKHNLIPLLFFMLNGKGGSCMLVLTRRLQESIVIGGDILMRVTSIDDSEQLCIELGILLPDSIAITLPEIELGYYEVNGYNKR
jgi:carbon storage regulator CsrA